ncbi:hypothetical protein EJD97_004414 [Solanum chilense]|uniref:Uncharacterized protein n=1 Tax=Solanum chilense TaxID=4083 RepID=A0A6N2BTB4_SOLCI|nr:hypothetical protein EJD97_004414 [Solanum chilense]
MIGIENQKLWNLGVGDVLTVIDRQDHDDSWMGRMFGMAEFHLWISCCTVTEDQIETQIECYPLTDSVIYICRMGPDFQELIDDDDDDATADEEDGLDEDEPEALGTRDDASDEA